MTTLCILAAVYVGLLTIPFFMYAKSSDPGTNAVRFVVAGLNAGVVAVLVAAAVLL